MTSKVLNQDNSLGTEVKFNGCDAMILLMAIFYTGCFKVHSALFKSPINCKAAKTFIKSHMKVQANYATEKSRLLILEGPRVIGYCFATSFSGIQKEENLASRGSLCIFSSFD